MSAERDIALVDELLGAGEAGCVEFKRDNVNPEVIGQYISALANAAIEREESCAYLLWGIDDRERKVIGTAFDSSQAKQGNQPLEIWLSAKLKPSVAFSFRQIDHPDGKVVLLEIPVPTDRPVEFDRVAYIRIGSAKTRLSDHPERQKVIWSRLQSLSWEKGVAAEYQDGDSVLRLLDYTSYFDLVGLPLPDNRNGIFDRLEQEGLIVGDVGGRWSVLNIAAILFAKSLKNFGQALQRKALRFTAYNGAGGSSPVIQRYELDRGYAAGFEVLIERISALVPKNEIIGAAFRSDHPTFPEIAIRELVANAMIHQDLTITGSGPTVRLFSNRIEFANPGQPLVKIDRFIDASPRSRNEHLASLMRRMNLCEEEGTGIDKIVTAAELYQLPPPDFRSFGGLAPATMAILFAPRDFAQMTVEERVRACYQHASLRWVVGETMKNLTLRERFGIDPANSAQVSNVIRMARDRNLIKSADPARPQAAYVPYWA